MQSPEIFLAQHFAGRGYVRRPRKDRAKEGYARYNKGTEVRLVVTTRAELNRVRAALRKVGFRPGRAFLKHGQYVQPVYGANAADWFTEHYLCWPVLMGRTPVMDVDFSEGARPDNTVLIELLAR